jgi:hypothetical protein
MAICRASGEMRDRLMKLRQFLLWPPENCSKVRRGCQSNLILSQLIFAGGIHWNKIAAILGHSCPQNVFKLGNRIQPNFN